MYFFGQKQDQKGGNVPTRLEQKLPKEVGVTDCAYFNPYFTKNLNSL